MRKDIIFLALLTGLFLTGCDTSKGKTAKVALPEKPNFIIFFTDDLGYNDIECYGAPRIRTPNLNKMAEEGVRFTDFYAQAVCGPSRAALLTGSYPIRIAEPGNTKGLHTKLHPKELTIAELLKAEDYLTACIGKWHAGEGKGQMPLDQGFDYFMGTPLFNGFTKLIEDASFRCQVIRNTAIIDTINNVEEMGQLTRMYTEEAVNFIRQNKDVPFFLYLAHNMPHVPLGASPAFRGKSEDGFYGDVIEELDWSMGEILKVLKEENLDENTLLIFTSDNGPWIEDGIDDHAGSAFPLKGNKMQTWEGGIRVPCIMRWPGQIRAGTESHELLTTMDFFPTFSELSGAAIPHSLILDGKSFSDVILEGEESRHEYFYYYAYTHLQAVRDREWKLVVPRPAKPGYMGWWARKIDAVEEVKLFHISVDKAEKYNVADQYPDKVSELMAALEQARSELGDKDRIGRGARFFDEEPTRERISEYEQWENTK
jgi:arylsulfatase A-like enzyme